MIRNTSLSGRVRAQAQLQLSQMHAYTRPTQIKNRCVASGTARSVFRDFRINRVSGKLRPMAASCPRAFDIMSLILYSSTVPIPYAGSRWRTPRCEEGQLVIVSVLCNIWTHLVELFARWRFLLCFLWVETCTVCNSHFQEKSNLSLSF